MFQVSNFCRSWLVDLHSQNLGWLVVDKFLHKQGNKDVPAGTELLSSPLLNMIFINPLSTHTCQPTGENVLTLSPRDENGEKLSEGTPAGCNEDKGDGGGGGGVINFSFLTCPIR